MSDAAGTRTVISERPAHEGRVYVEVVSTSLEAAREAAESWRDRNFGYDATLDGPPERTKNGWTVTGRRWAKL
jgi:hypothetical protein